MRSTFFTVALCAATTLAAPHKVRRDDLNVLDETIAHIEQILGTDDPSESKLQDILNTIVNDIEARDAEPEEDSYETVLEHVSDIMNEAGTAEDKVGDILDELLVAVNSDPTKRDLLSGLDLSELDGLDLSELDSLDLSGLLEDLSYLVDSLEQELSSSDSSGDPLLGNTLEELQDGIEDVLSEIQSGELLTKRDLLGLDPDVIGSLDSSDLLNDMECIVAKLEKAVTEQHESMDTSLASAMEDLLQKVDSATANVKDALSL